MKTVTTKRQKMSAIAKIQNAKTKMTLKKKSTGMITIRIKTIIGFQRRSSSTTSLLSREISQRQIH